MSDSIPASHSDVTLPNIVARLERLPYSKWHVKSGLFIGVATLFDGMDSLMIAYVLPVILVLFHMNVMQIGLLISTSFVGQLLGALFFGWYAERIGRLRALQITVIIYAIMSFVCMFAWDFTSMFIFRLIQGLGLGGEVPVAAAYMNEWGQAKGRGRFVVIYQAFFSVGLVTGAVLGYFLVPTLGWQVMFLIGALPATLTVFVRRILPESPRWLAGVGRIREADKALSRVENEISEGGKVALPAPKERRLELLAKKTSVRELFSAAYRRRTFVVWIIYFTVYLALNSLQTWVVTIYATVFKMALVQALQYSLLTPVVQLTSTVLCALFIDRTGRKPWITTAFMLGGIVLFVLWYAGAKTAEMVLVLWNLSYLIFGGIANAIFVYTPEVYPTRMRALGNSVATSWLRLASAIGPTMVAFVLTGYGIPWVFFYAGAVLIFGGLITGAFGIETKGRVLEELSP
jgi:putative MFS transporter